MSGYERESGVVWGRFADLPEREPIPGITMRPLSNDRMMLCWVELVADAVLPAHSHPHDQGGVVLEGGLTLTIAGETRILGPGDGFVIPGGVEHAAVAGPGGARTVDIFAPPREDYRT